MNGYLLSIIGIVLISGLLSVILPEGKTAQIIRNTAKLCCLIVILSPVVSFIKGDENKDFFGFSSKTVIETDDTFINYCSKERIKNAEKEISEYVKQTYSTETEIILICEDGETEYKDEIRITKVLVKILSGNADQEKMEKELTELFGVEVKIETG